jgi:pyridoxamine 5'-phosphate oxidase
MKAPATDLDELLVLIWSRLEKGVIDHDSSLHTPALGTQSPDGPAVRTVVLRAVDVTNRILTCHTDRRSNKVAELAGDVRVAWMFYDYEVKVQMRLSGVAVIHENDSRSDERWHASNLSSLEVRMPTAEETEQHGRAHFAVLDTVVARIDWLSLASKGHRRARFCWKEERWQGSWVVP